MNHQQTILIKHFYQETEAHLYAAKLRESGIESFFSNANMNSMFTADFASIGLHVDQEDAVKAQQIIEGLDLQSASDDPNFSYEEASEEDILLEKGLLEARHQRSNRIFYFIAAAILLVGIILGYLDFLAKA